MNNKDDLIARIENVQDWLLNARPSSWAIPQEREKNIKRLWDFLEVIRLDMQGEKVVINDLDESPRSRAEEVFSMKDESLKSDKPATLSSSIE